MSSNGRQLAVRCIQRLYFSNIMKIFDYKCSSKNYKLSILNTYQWNEIKKNKRCWRRIQQTFWQRFHQLFNDELKYTIIHNATLVRPFNRLFVYNLYGFILLWWNYKLLQCLLEHNFEILSKRHITMSTYLVFRESTWFKWSHIGIRIKVFNNCEYSQIYLFIALICMMS